VLLCGVVAVATLFLDYHSTSDLLGIAAGVAAVLLVLALPRLRDDEYGGRAFLASTVAVGVLGAVVLVTVLVVHAWRWISFAALVFVICLVSEAIDYARARSAEESLEQEPPELRKLPSDVWQNLPRF
jgi:MFS family permease